MRPLLILLLACSLALAPLRAAPANPAAPAAAAGRHLLVMTPEEFTRFQAQHPQLVELSLSPQEARQLFAQLTGSDAATSDPEEAAPDETQPQPPFPTEQAEPVEPAYAGGYSPRPNFYFHLDTAWGGDADDLIVVVLAAAVVFALVAAVLYAGEFVGRNLHSQPRLWRNDRRFYLAGQGFRLQSGSPQAGASQEQGLLTGLGLVVQERHVNPSLGLQAELGQITANFLLGQGERNHRLQGIYGLIGPRLEYELGHRGEAGRLFANLLGGTANNAETGLMSLMQVGYGADLPGNRWSWQLQAGSLYLDLDSSLGVQRYKNDFNFVVGMQLAHRF